MAAVSLSILKSISFINLVGLWYMFCGKKYILCRAKAHFGTKIIQYLCIWALVSMQGKYGVNVEWNLF